MHRIWTRIESTDAAFATHRRAMAENETSARHGLHADENAENSPKHKFSTPLRRNAPHIPRSSFATYTGPRTKLMAKQSGELIDSLLGKRAESEQKFATLTCAVPVIKRDTNSSTVRRPLVDVTNRLRTEAPPSVPTDFVRSGAVDTDFESVALCTRLKTLGHAAVLTSSCAQSEGAHAHVRQFKQPVIPPLPTSLVSDDPAPGDCVQMAHGFGSRSIVVPPKAIVADCARGAEPSLWSPTAVALVAGIPREKARMFVSPPRRMPRTPPALSVGPRRLRGRIWVRTWPPAASDCSPTRPCRGCQRPDVFMKLE